MNQRCGYYDSQRERQCGKPAEIARHAFAGTPMEYVCTDHYFIAESVK